MEKFVLIDGNNIVFRSYYALPRLSNFEGVISNGVFGFCNILVKIIKEVKPKYIAVCFDSAKKNFRHEMFKEYKGKRRPTPDELIAQFPIVKDVLRAMNVAVVEQNGLEADDLIGCLSRQFNGMEKIILTADKDCLQLISDDVKIMQPQKGISEEILIDEAKLKELYSLTPSQIIDYKALCGDASDNIPGVHGIGDKTAVSLLNNYSTLDGVYENLDKLNAKTAQKLVDYKDDAYMSYKLATIVTDKKLDFELSDFEYSFPFNNDVLEYFKKYQFNSLIKREDLFDLSTATNVKKYDIEIVKLDNEKLQILLEQLLKEQCVAIHFNEEKISLSDFKKEYEVDAGANNFKTLSPLFESEKVEKICYDLKSKKHFLRKFGINFNNATFDVMVARYVINSGASSNVTYNDVINENLLDNNLLAYSLFALKDIYIKKMEEYDTKYVFYDIEMPLIDVLYNMEIEGIKIDKAELDNLQEKYKLQIADLTNMIYGLAGKQFNINSPKQLGEILFDEMGIKSYNNKKKSTSAQVLTEIQNAHPIIPLILEYRQISKLYTTYILAYQQLIDDKHKIYTIFNQTLTTTGRLSSSEPNLQNIPIRTEEGKNLRKLFIPSHEDGVIIDADYNQIELRLLATLCGDEKLIRVYNSGRDIHASTASEIFDIPICDVTPEIRRQAKAINFGIVYGISDYGLGQNIGISRAQASEYIKRYFARYPRIEQYMKSNVEYCREHGYVKTLYGRIRLIPEISSSNYMIRSFGERASMNMPLQGTASDIIKIAMIRVYNELKGKGLKSKLILQVHDELLVDAVKEEEQQVREILKSCMEDIAGLKVPLIAEINSGNNWYEAH